MNTAAGRKRNWAPWTALLLALAAVLVNVAFFMGQFSGQQAFVWLSLGLALLALVYAGVGLVRAFGKSQLYRGKVSSPVLGLVVVLLALFAGFAFRTARALPDTHEAPKLGERAPDFTLRDTAGTEVSLNQMLTTPLSAEGPNTRPHAVLLVFYRGYW